jgi:hypothetical protein
MKLLCLAFVGTGCLPEHCGIIMRFKAHMAGIFNTANWRVWGKLLWSFIASALIGAGLILLGILYGWEFSRALGDAFLVAGIIGVCVELFAATRIIEHASTEVSAKMAGYGLPKAAQTVIYNVVHKTRLVYRDYRRLYRITRSEKPRTIVVESTISYCVVNNGKGNELYRPQLAEEGIYSPKILSLQYSKYTIDPAQLERKVESTGVITFRPAEYVAITESKASTAMENLQPDQHCLVRWVEQLEMPDTYSDVTAFSGMTVFPVIELTNADGFDFFASEDNDCEHVGQTWQYKRGFVAGQHVRAWWRPRPPTPPSATNP